MAKIYFDELEIRDYFKEEINQIFQDKEDLIGEAVLVTESTTQEVVMPCCVVSILNPTSITRYDDSDGGFRIVQFSLNCDLYSKELKDYNLEDSVIFLSQILIKGIMSKYSSFDITRNNPVPYRADAHRRTVTFRCVYDSADKIIYTN